MRFDFVVRYHVVLSRLVVRFVEDFNVLAKFDHSGLLFCFASGCCCGCFLLWRVVGCCCCRCCYGCDHTYYGSRYMLNFCLKEKKQFAKDLFFRVVHTGCVIALRTGSTTNHTTTPKKGKHPRSKGIIGREKITNLRATPHLQYLIVCKSRLWASMTTTCRPSRPTGRHAGSGRVAIMCV